MARWQLMGDWPHGAVTIPAGTEIIVGPDGTATYNHMPLTLPLPINAQAMDDEALDLMKRWYGRELWHRLLVGPDVGKPAAQNTSETSPQGKKRSA
jgi:hypothetical protein